VYSPVACPNGVHAFGRDVPSSHAVWSSENGYPGDVSYRDFYRDIGFELPLDYIRKWIHEGDIRISTGIKYYAITGKSDFKRPYRIDVAAQKAKEHAANFIYHRLKQTAKLQDLMDRPPVIVCPYDAELFGHWWFEGPMWLENVIRGFAEQQPTLEMVTPGDYLRRHPNNARAVPSFSSWGNNGYAEVWLDASNDWIYPHIHKAIDRMAELVERFPEEEGLKLRALNQAARELMLAQASDWPFIMKTGTTVPYATKRVKEHLSNFATIFEGLRRNAVNTEWLTRMERKNNLFSDIDYRLFGDPVRTSTSVMRAG
jgi:1,4-alpha-glucan branching enzyme